VTGEPSQAGAPAVVHLISSKGGVGGAEKVVAALAGNADRFGWSAAIINPFAANASSAEFSALYGGIRYEQRVTSHYGQLIGARRWTASVLRQLTPSIVHVHLYHATVLAATLTPPAGARWLVTHHYGPLFERQRKTASADLDRWATHRLERAVAISADVRDYLVNRCRIGEQDATLIYNGWSGDPIRAAATSSPPTAVCVANFRAEKGHEVLLQAFVEVAQRVPGARLILVGSGPLEGRARAQVQESGLGSAIIFTGTVRDVWPVLATADVFVLASWYEPLGIAVLEAMAAGLPVVATGAGGVRELVDPGVTGWLVPPGDHSELARRVVQVLTNAELRGDFGRAAVKAATAKSEASMVAKYYEVYNSLVTP
jgi:glycosyltransferase involved in cell wall biosynthesis